MVFIINNMKYDTDKMEKVADVKKRYPVGGIWSQYVTTIEDCGLWKTKRGNWLLTRKSCYGSHCGEAIKEAEAKELLLRYAWKAYEKEFGEIEEA